MVISSGMSSTAKRLARFWQWATSASCTAALVMPGMAMMLTFVTSSNAARPVRLPGASPPPMYMASSGLLAVAVAAAGQREHGLLAGRVAREGQHRRADVLDGRHLDGHQRRARHAVLDVARVLRVQRDGLIDLDHVAAGHLDVHFARGQHAAGHQRGVYDVLLELVFKRHFVALHARHAVVPGQAAVLIQRHHIARAEGGGVFQRVGLGGGGVLGDGHGLGLALGGGRDGHADVVCPSGRGFSR